MKMTVESHFKDFRPFTLKIEALTKRDLEFLWALFGGSKSNLVDFLNNTCEGVNIEPFVTSEPVIMESDDMWDVLNDKLKPAIIK